jgi:hypothetical protein
MTYAQIGLEMGISGSCAHQICQRALGKLARTIQKDCLRTLRAGEQARQRLDSDRGARGAVGSLAPGGRPFPKERKLCKASLVEFVKPWGARSSS